MSDNKGFFQIILLSFGVLTVFGLVLILDDFPMPVQNETKLPLTDYWPDPEDKVWEEVSKKIAPMAVVICFMGIAAYVVTHR